MRVLITGIHGTVGSELRKLLESQGHLVTGWDRSRVGIERYQEMEDFVRLVHPDYLFHLAIASRPTGKPDESWKVNYDWTSELAWICRMLSVRFVFTSTVMVFSDLARGPFTPESMPDAVSGYGYEKRMSEVRVRYQNPDSLIVRLGWQIGETSGSNNMLDFLENKQKEEGCVRASTKWLPACSFLPDTAAALLKLAFDGNSGIFLADSNRRWSFYQIAQALSVRNQNRWKVAATEDFFYDQRMIDSRTELPPLEERLPELKIR
jgi:dTDP-4-dehydrorhamnose reductase